jgi:hypothetical protein
MMKNIRMGTILLLLALFSQNIFAHADIVPNTDHPLIHMTKHVFADGMRKIPLRKTMLEVSNFSLAPYLRYESTLWLKVTLSSATAFPEQGAYRYVVIPDKTFREEGFKKGDAQTKAKMAIATGNVHEPVTGVKGSSVVTWIKVDYSDIEK